MKSFLKKYRYLIFLLILVSLFLLTKILFPSPKEKILPYLPSPAPYSQISSSNSWENILPGISTVSEIEGSLGQPIKKEDFENQTVYYYPSENKNWPNQVFISKDQQKADFIKVYFPKDKYQDYLNKFGPLEKEMFGNHSQADFSVFVFNNKGVSIIANKKSGVVLEAWYFPPTNIENFLQTIGKDFKDTPEEQL